MSDKHHNHSDQRNTNKRVCVCWTASKRTLLQWRIMSDDHLAIIFVNYFCEKHLLAVIPASLHCVQRKHLMRN